MDVCCEKCFSIDEIISYIKTNGIKGDCPYCKSKDIIIVPILKLADFINRCINKKYEEAADQVPFDKENGDYLLDTTDIIDLLVEEEKIFSDILAEPNKLATELVGFNRAPIVRQDPFGDPSGGDKEREYWYEFCELVINKKRFTSFYKEKSKFNFPTNTESLFALFRDIFKRDPYLFTLKEGKIIYRARLYEDNIEFNNKSLTAPPASKTIDNRMSPAGISFFYGSFEIDTCIAEIRPALNDIVVVGNFKLKKDLKVIDLSRYIPEIHSIFSDKYDFYNDEFINPFLQYFTIDISKPIRLSDKKLEYIPTQVFTEFIRFNLDEEIIGMKFDSSLKSDGNNIVLFAGPEISGSTGNAWLDYIGYNQCRVDKIDYYSIVLNN